MYSSTSFLASSATIVPAASIAANFDRRPVEAFVSGSPKIQFVDDKQRKALGRSDVVAFLNAEDTATSCDVGSLAEIDDAAESGRTIKIDGKELRATSASTRRGRREETAYDVWGTVFVQRKRGGETYCFRGYRAKRVVKVFGAQGTNVTDVVDVAEERGSVFVATSDGDVVFCARKEISDEVWHAGKSESGIVLLSGTPATTGRNDSRREDDGDDDDEEGREDPVALI